MLHVNIAKNYLTKCSYRSINRIVSKRNKKKEKRTKKRL